MKPRSAVAAFIVQALANADRSALYSFAQSYKQKSHKPLTQAQKERVGVIYDHYLDAIKHTLAITPFEGDTAEVDGVDLTATTTADTSTGDQDQGSSSAAGDVEGLGFIGDALNHDQAAGAFILSHVLSGGRTPPGLTITFNISDVTINA